MIYTGPTKEDIQTATIQLKNGKAAGPDDIPAEEKKVDTDTSAEMLYPLFLKTWKNNEVPVEWKKEYHIKLSKKEDLSLCSNYRGITSFLPIAMASVGTKRAA